MRHEPEDPDPHGIPFSGKSRIFSSPRIVPGEAFVRQAAREPLIFPVIITYNTASYGPENRIVPDVRFNAGNAAAGAFVNPSCAAAS